MEQTLTAWLLPAITLVAGIAIGFLIARLAPNAAPSRTQRHSVAALTGTTGAGLFGFFTSCDSRSRALSGSWSNGVMVAATGAGLALVVALRCWVVLVAIACTPINGVQRWSLLHFPA